MQQLILMYKINRTASDLEEWGWIDKTQKGVVKDLIISGNQNLQTALEKFEKGDTSELQGKKRCVSFHFFFKFSYCPFVLFVSF